MRVRLLFDPSLFVDWVETVNWYERKKERRELSSRSESLMSTHIGCETNVHLVHFCFDQLRGRVD